MWDARRSAWILPFRDPENNKLMGWQEKGTLNRTFMNRPPGLARSRTLFGLPQLREDVVYLVESPLDCARLYTAGYPGAVAVCGSTIKEEQVKLIRSSSRIIAAFDNPKVDQAGKKVSDDIRKLALKYGLNLSYFNYGESGSKDPGDLSDEDIKWGIDHAQSFLIGQSAYV
jgi:DNA primase